MQEITISQYLLLLIGMMIVTYLPRSMPLLVLSRLNMPKLVIEFLKLIPIAILGALLMPLILMSEDKVNLSLNNEYLIVGLITCLIATKVKKLGAIVIIGIVLIAIWRQVLS